MFYSKINKMIHIQPLTKNDNDNKNSLRILVQKSVTYICMEGEGVDHYFVCLFVCFVCVCVYVCVFVCVCVRVCVCVCVRMYLRPFLYDTFFDIEYSFVWLI